MTLRFCLLAAWLVVACTASPPPAAPSAVPAAHPASALTFRDLMPEYWQWWSRAQAAPAAQQADSFWRAIALAHPELYSANVLGKSFADEAAAHEALQKYFADMPALVADMRAVSERMHDLLRDGYAQFVAAFPDMAWTGPVYIMPSILKFDGGTRALANRPELIFAPDGIARYHRIDGKVVGLCPFIAHELFHIYHHQFFGNTSSDGAMWQSLWIEGLATYVGSRLCPASSEAEVLMSTTLAGEARPRLAEIAGEMRAKLDATDDATGNRFFTAGPPADLPRRSGYFLGYLVAERAARTRSLVELARLDPAVIRGVIETELDALGRDAGP
jgi:hypothetical protein